MMPLEAALERMLDRLEPLAVETVGLEDALGRVLAEPVSSRLTLPPWDNSAMDGFAVRARDVAAASSERPVVLRVVGDSAAGHATSVGVTAKTAIRILTGAPLPDGADAVVPVEETDCPTGMAELPASVGVLAPATIGAHVRRAGGDLRSGDLLLDAGQALSAAALSVAAAGGHGEVRVHRRPTVAVLATGDELLPPGATPGAAQIPDSNSVGLLAQAREAGAEARSLGIAADDLADVERRLGDALGWADVIVVSGGVSVGAHDVVKDAFEQLGEMTLWRVAVQPGKPLAFGRAPAGDRPPAGGGSPAADPLPAAGDRPPAGSPPPAAGDRPADVLLFGLPGNPVSSFVTFELFVRPVLRRLGGYTDLSGRETVRARLAEPVTKSVGRRAFLRVTLESRNDELPPWRARLAGGQGSHVLSALVAADGLAIVPEEIDGLPTGAEVDVIRLRSETAGR